MRSDSDLLRAYADSGSEAAFTELVARHLPVLYRAALRQTRDPHKAQDVVQLVFTETARQAKTLCQRPVLLSWLYTVVHHTAANMRRRDQRRAKREMEVAVMNEANGGELGGIDADHLAQVIDEAMQELREVEKEAVLLRFFQGASLKEVAAALTTTEEAARKRVTRGLANLEAALARRGVTSASAALAGAFSTTGRAAIPAGLSAVVAENALSSLVSAGALTSTALPLATIMKAYHVGLAAVIAVAGLGLYYHVSETRGLRAEVGLLRERNSKMLVGYRAARSEFKETIAERDAKEKMAQMATDPAASELRGNLESLKAYLERNPEKNIPELTQLKPQDWLKIASDFPLNTDEDLRKAAAALRLEAKKRIGLPFALALKAYLDANDQRLPTDPTEIAPYFEQPVPVEILARYKVLSTPEVLEGLKAGRSLSLIVESERVDDTHDSVLEIGSRGGFGWKGYDHKQSDEEKQLVAALQIAQKRFQAANPGKREPSSREEAVRYIDAGSVDPQSLDYWVKTGSVRK